MNQESGLPPNKRPKLSHGQGTPPSTMYTKNNVCPKSLMDYVVKFSDFDSLLQLRAANREMLRVADNEIQTRSTNALQGYGGLILDDRLYLRTTSGSSSSTELPKLVQEAASIPQQRPCQTKMTRSEISNLMQTLFQNGYADLLTNEGCEWSFEASVIGEDELKKDIDINQPNTSKYLPLPMKAVDDVFHYLKAIGWSSAWHRVIYKTFKRYLFPLLSHATITGQAHLIVENNKGNYVYKEILNFVSREGATFELVAIDRCSAENKTVG